MKGLIESEKKNFDAFPDFKMPVQSIIAEVDQAAVYLMFEGTLLPSFIGKENEAQYLLFFRRHCFIFKPCGIIQVG